MQDVSVIIPVYNRRSLVIDALDSVARQTVLPKYVTIVDDGSTDGTFESVKDWISRRESTDGVELPRYSLQRQRKVNAAAARNTGMLSTPRTKHITFLDSDDIWPADFLKRTVCHLEQNEDAVAVSADRQFVSCNGRPLERDDCSKLASSPLNWLFRYGAGVASCTVFKTDAVDEAGGWCRNFESAEDLVLFSRICLLGPWNHVGGEPVTFRVIDSVELGEEGNLSRKFSDKFERWANVKEELYRMIVSRLNRSQRSDLRVQIGNCWYRAGKVHQRAGQPQSAADCFSKALTWAPYSLRTRFRRFQARRLIV